MSGRSASSGYIIARRDRWADEEWDQRLVGRPEATFFHTRTWARIVSSTFPACRDRGVWFEVSRAGEAEAGGEAVLFPLFAWRRAAGLLTTLHSSFPFLYGGPVPAFGAGADSEPSWLEALLPRIRSWGTSIQVTGNPFGRVKARGKSASTGSTAPAPDRISGYTMLASATQVLSLPKTEEEYWDGLLTSRRRNDVRRLRKKGVEIEESRKEEDILAVYRFYRDSFHRWGGEPSFVHPVEFYLALIDQGGDAVRLTVARFENRILGGSFTVRWNGIVHYLAGYMDHDSRALRPNVLLQIESIRQAIRDGYRLYDFLPSGGHESVEEFKTGLGGERVELPIFESQGLPHRLIRRLRSRGAKR